MHGSAWPRYHAHLHHHLSLRKASIPKRAEMNRRTNSSIKCLVGEKIQIMSEHVVLFLMIIFKLFVLVPALSSSPWLYFWLQYRSPLHALS